ncbi:hypothetical protein [Sphingopyxis sp. R3-92]|uniref:hypothetical protein n=1 Tax=Sphingopyxis sp. R3-92 TaxID=3158553 RepID=UPI003EE55665
MSEAVEIYCSCMEDVKARLALLKSITGGLSPLGSDGLDGEVVCLLLRRVVEQIAFGSLVAHKETYESAHNDLNTVWSAKRLVKRLEKIHADFFPMPVKRGVSPYVGVAHHFEPLNEGFLTRDELEFLYDKTSDGIHTWNPFKEADRVLNFERSISEWVARIEALLEHHFVRFVGTKDLWLIQMDSPEDHRVHAYIAPMVVELASPPKITVTFDFAQWPSSGGS